MSDHGTWDALATEAGAFERLVADDICPPPGVMLLAIAAEFSASTPCA